MVPKMQKGEEIEECRLHSTRSEYSRFYLAEFQPKWTKIEGKLRNIK